MSSTLQTSYLGEGLLASRPATPDIDPACCALWWATDQPAGSQLSVYAASAWTTASGGYSSGAPPTVVQFAFNVNGTKSVTFSLAPTNGNLLVAMSFNPSTSTGGAGWTKVVEVTTGTDFGDVWSKVAGGAESTTQSPLNADPGGGVGTIVCWELHHGTGTPVIAAAATQAEQTGVTNTMVPFPNVSDCIGLSAVSVVTATTIGTVRNVGTQDVKDNTSARRVVAGHTDLSKSPNAGILAALSGSGSSKGATAIVSAP